MGEAGQPGYLVVFTGTAGGHRADLSDVAAQPTRSPGRDWTAGQKALGNIRSSCVRRAVHCGRKTIVSQLIAPHVHFSTRTLPAGLIVWRCWSFVVALVRRQFLD